MKIEIGKKGTVPFLPKLIITRCGVGLPPPKNTPTRNGRFVNRPYKHDEHNRELPDKYKIDLFFARQGAETTPYMDTASRTQRSIAEK